MLNAWRLATAVAKLKRYSRQQRAAGAQTRWNSLFRGATKGVVLC